MESNGYESFSVDELESDRRTYIRFQPDDQVRQTLLVVRKREYPAKLINLSAGGCEVTTSLKVKVKLGDQIKLLSKMGRFVTRVTHLDATGDELRLGLQLVAEFVNQRGNEIRSLEHRKIGEPEAPPAVQNRLMPWIVLGLLVVLGALLGNAGIRDQVWQQLKSVGAPDPSS